jgi:histone-lysine N-methyltransferase SETMAR
LNNGELIWADRGVTLLELSQEVGISAGSTEDILHELVVRKVSARWVPHLLTTEYRERCLVAVTQLLQQYEREGGQFLDSVVICDETWVHYFISESKKASTK